MPAVVRQGRSKCGRRLFLYPGRLLSTRICRGFIVYITSSKKITISLNRLVRFLFLWQFFRIRDTKLIYGFTGNPFKGQIEKIARRRLYRLIHQIDAEGTR
ncbi:hypothetical protein GWJ21_16005 [Bacillus coagulans]|nr:hypothetical protein [Heyndrickxia coagulans]